MREATTMTMGGEGGHDALTPCFAASWLLDEGVGMTYEWAGLVSADSILWAH